MLLGVVTDLLFGVKIASTAKTLDVPYRGVRSLEALRERAPGAALVVVDLEAELADGTPIEAIELARSLDRPVIAYASHVAVDAIASARAAGATQVMARSAFVTRLPEIVHAAGTRSAETPGA